MMSRRRGIYFKPHILKMPEEYAKETDLNTTEIVSL